MSLLGLENSLHWIQMSRTRRRAVMFTSSLEASSSSPSPYLDQIFAITQCHRPFHITLLSVKILQLLGSLCKAIKNIFSCWQMLGIRVYHLQSFKTNTTSYTFPILWHVGAETSPFQLPMTTFDVADIPSPDGEFQISSKMLEASTTWTDPFMATLFSCGSELCSRL